MHTSLTAPVRAVESAACALISAAKQHAGIPSCFKRHAKNDITHPLPHLEKQKYYVNLLATRNEEIIGTLFQELSMVWRLKRNCDHFPRHHREEKYHLMVHIHFQNLFLSGDQVSEVQL